MINFIGAKEVGSVASCVMVPPVMSMISQPPPPLAASLLARSSFTP